MSVGFCGALMPGVAIGGSSRMPLLIDVEQERAELLAEPERPVRRDLHRLGVEVEAGEQPRGRVAAARRRRDGLA